MALTSVLRRLTDSLNNLLAKIAKQEAVLQQDNVKLTQARSSYKHAALRSVTLGLVEQEYTKSAAHFQDLQKKARHFTALDRRQ
jgi:FKBP-type peptidyl-prolyl cis-trans isomerase (trigger factor)